MRALDFKARRVGIVVLHGAGLWGGLKPGGRQRPHAIRTTSGVHPKGGKIFYLFIIIIIAYCLLRQSPISGITYIALIMTISDYRGN